MKTRKWESFSTEHQKAVQVANHEIKMIQKQQRKLIADPVIKHQSETWYSIGHKQIVKDNVFLRDIQVKVTKENKLFVQKLIDITDREALIRAAYTSRWCKESIDLTLRPLLKFYMYLR